MAFPGSADFGSLLPDDWLLSRRAVRTFLFCVLMTLALTPVFLGALANVPVTPANQIALGVGGVVGSLALISLWVGMWRFWARFDNSPRSAKRGWFVFLLVGGWYASCAYYVLVYRPQVLRKTANS